MTHQSIWRRGDHFNILGEKLFPFLRWENRVSLYLHNEISYVGKMAFLLDIDMDLWWKENAYHVSFPFDTKMLSRSLNFFKLKFKWISKIFYFLNTIKKCIWFNKLSEWVIKFNSLMGTADIGVHAVHTSRVILTYTLESLSSLTQITHNLFTGHD